MIEQIPEPERAPSVKVVDENIVMPVERALGIIWDTNSDCFVYEVVKRNIAETRRKMLSLTAALFDPTGILAPFLVRAKILLQQLWHCGIGWDDLLAIRASRGVAGRARWNFSISHLPFLSSCSRQPICY